MKEHVRETEPGPAHASECYFLPIDALPIVMSQIGQVSLGAQITTLPQMATGPYQIALTLCQGAVICCQIFRVHSGIVLDGEHALHTLRSIGDILWDLSFPCQFESGELPDSAMVSNWLAPIPCRMPAAVALQQLPQRIRHVLSLVDGSRNLLQIAHMLHLPPEDVFQILRQACAEGWIDEFTSMEDIYS
jgi:hypothetical protein